MLTFWIFSFPHLFSDHHFTPSTFRFAYKDEFKGDQKMDEGVKYKKVTYDQLYWKWSLYIKSAFRKYKIYGFINYLQGIVKLIVLT